MEEKLYLYKASCHIGGVSFLDEGYPLIMDYEIQEAPITLYLHPILIHVKNGRYACKENYHCIYNFLNEIGMEEINSYYLSKTYGRDNMLYLNNHSVKEIIPVDEDEFDSLLEQSVGDESAIIILGNYFSLRGDAYDVDDYVTEVIDGSMITDLTGFEPWGAEYIVGIDTSKVQVNINTDYIVFPDVEERGIRYCIANHGKSKFIFYGQQNYIYVSEYTKVAEVTDKELIEHIVDTYTLYEGDYDPYDHSKVYDERMRLFKYISMM